MLLDDLTVSGLNVRKQGAKDIAGLGRSLLALGILQPILVGPADPGYEVVAGKCRFIAASRLAGAGYGGFDTLPALVLDAGDDAAAIKASLTENIARLPMDEMDQHGVFATLIGRAWTRPTWPPTSPSPSRP